MKKGKSKLLSWDKSLPEDSHLAPELVREVLARLPVKSVLKFRCVCKTWCSIIDSSDFISLHFKVYNKNTMKTSRLLAVQDVSNEYRITIRQVDTFREVGKLVRVLRGFKTLGSCNGLVLIEYEWLISCMESHNRTMKLWNPFIRKSLIIPHFPTVAPISKWGFFLGFAPSTTDYKVLAIDTVIGDVAIYSLCHRRWRVITNQGRGLSWARSPNCFSGGSIYWVNMDERTVLISFDFNLEEFRSVQLPYAVKESMVWFAFPHCESIAVFTMSSHNSCMWILEKDGREDPWSLYFSGGSDSDACKHLESIAKKNMFFAGQKFLYVQKSNSLLMIHLSTEDCKTRMWSYNLTDHKFKQFAKSLNGLMYFDTCTETLALHKDIEAQTTLTLSP